MNSVMKKAMVKLFIKVIETYMGKYAKKVSVEIKDEGVNGFEINIKVFDSLDNVLKKAGNTLSGILKK